jgi:heat shock protein HtpX
MNIFKTAILLTALTALLVFFGNLFGGASGAMIAFGVALLMNVFSFWYSDKIVLSMTKARPVTADQEPGLYALVERIATRAGIPTPKLYVIDDPQPNAFATGRNPDHAAIAVNTGLLNILDRPEVEGVIAHEIAHIKHRDTLTMTVVATIAGAIMLLASFARFAALFGGGNSRNGEGANVFGLLAMAILAPIAALMIQMGISRAREYEADRLGAELAGTPKGLANALMKLERGAEMIPNEHMPPQAAHLCIVNPLRGGGLASLFSTHPPVQERVRRLLSMA